MAFLSTVLRSVVCFIIIKGVLGDPLEKNENGPIDCFRTLKFDISLYLIWTGAAARNSIIFSSFLPMKFVEKMCE